MASNVGKKRSLDDEPPQASHKEQRITSVTEERLATSELHPRCSAPSASILPPERQGGIQTLLASASPETDETWNGRVSFKYNSLSDGEIRLLRVHPGRFDDPVHCSLVVDNVDAPSSYEALSYVWNDPHPANNIFLSHEAGTGTFGTATHFTVGDNLYDALRRLRMVERPVMLWVDALCIDQDNVDEKGQQVRQMQEIYERAHNVLLWLGEGNAAIEWALSNLNLASRPGFFRRHDKRALGFVDERAFAFLVSAMHLFNSPYWRRMWVVQEIASARRATIVCGAKQLDWLEFSTLVEFLLLSKPDIEERNASFNSLGQHDYYVDLSGLDRAAEMISLATASLQRSPDGQVIGRPISLSKLVLDTTHLQHSDPRNKIYALLGLVHGSKDMRLSLQPDYASSTLETYGAAVEHMVESSKSLDIVLQPWAPLTRQDSRQSPAKPAISTDVPSWIALVEDLPFGDPNKKTACACDATRRTNGDNLVFFNPWYNASKAFSAEAEFGTVVKRSIGKTATRDYAIAEASDARNVGNTNLPSLGKPRSPVLRCNGIELGTITDLSTRMADGIISRDALEMGGMSFTEGCEAIMHSKSTRLWDRLWRTLVADRDANGKPAPSRFGHAFFSIFKQVLKLRSMDTVEMLEAGPGDNVVEFLSRVRDVTWNRRMFRSSINKYDENFLGLAPRSSQVGDKIAILFGCSVPVIVRQDLSVGDGYVRIVGPAYVYGKMEGEALSALDETAIDSLTQVFQVV